MGIICSPACRYWVWLYYKGPDDYDAICDCPKRREPNGKQMGLPEEQVCKVGKHINDHSED